MQKRYTPVADLAESEDSGPNVVRMDPDEFLATGTHKAFHLTARWEYRRLDRPAGSALLSEHELNQLGSDGWELAGLVSDTAGVHYFLKRGRGTAGSG